MLQAPCIPELLNVQEAMRVVVEKRNIVKSVAIALKLIKLQKLQREHFLIHPKDSTKHIKRRHNPCEFETSF